MSNLMAAYQIVQILLLVLVGAWLIFFIWVEKR